MKKIVYLLTSALLLSLSSCKKKEDKERPEFDYQPQHFSCYVNGEEFVPRVQGMCGGTKTFYDPDGFLNSDPGHLAISGIRCLADDIVEINLVFSPIFNDGFFFINDSLLDYSSVRYAFADQRFFGFKGQIHITKLEPQTYRPFVQGRIEGTFEMSCANDQGDTVHITDGSFSLNLR